MTRYGVFGRRALAAVIGGFILGLMAAYLVARNYSAHEVQPQGEMVAYRVIASVVLMTPGIVLWVSAVRGVAWSDVWLRLVLLVAWFAGAGVASAMLGI